MASIRKIEATKIGLPKKLKVAAYARVSTDSDEQLLSLKTQKEHYTSYIKSNPDWEFAGIYFDEGITGTKVDKRDELLRLLKELTEYDETMVRLYIESIRIYDDRFEVTFKAGITVDVQR